MQRIEMIGAPIDHVLSPGILNPMFRAAGEPYEVVPVEVRTDGLAGHVALVRNDPALVGLIVTTPLKQGVRDHLRRETALAGFIGAANCIRCDGGDWIGANFDGCGFLAALAGMGVSIAGKRILLLGCGGAGGAIAASLVQDADIDLALCDIDDEKAAAFAGRLTAFAPGSTSRAVREPVGAFDVVVNASPVGMETGDPSPLPEETVAAAAVVADIVAVETALKRQAWALGKPLLEGEAMVRGQAALFRRFLLTGVTTEAEALAG